MGKKNTVWNHYLRDKRRFADVINGFLYQGEQIVSAEDLEELSAAYAQPRLADERGKPETNRIDRIRDIRMTAKTGETYCLYALENQQFVNYAMPFRCMQYDTMEYSRQLEEIRKRNAEEKNFENSGEWLCKVKKSDKLSPIYTICLYHGEEPWDGPRSLRDMMDFGEEGDKLSKYFADYPMRLVCLNEQTEFDGFRTEVKKVFRLMRFQKNRKLLQQEIETNPDYEEVDIETIEAISVMLDMPKLWEHRNDFMRKEESEGINMCQAVREMFESARMEGVTEGRAEGMQDNIRKIMKNLQMTAEEAMNVLEVQEEDRERLLSALQ